MKSIFTNLACSFVLLSIAGTANAIIITRDYSDPDGSGGQVTYSDFGGNAFEIAIDNTTVGDLSSIITGLVFNIEADINSTSFYMEDGAGNDITQYWDIDFNTGGNITPGNTQVDLYFDTTQGIGGGIYNGANPNNTNNAYTDIAVMYLGVIDPNPWVMAADGISEDRLRMQRTGPSGNGSLKIDGEEPPAGVPVPGTLFLLGLGLVGLAGSRRRNS
jgi:hypothetical protein